MSGYGLEELYQWPSFIELFHPEQRERILENHRRRLSGEDFETRYRTALQCKNGDPLEIEFAVALFATPTHNGVVCLARDIRPQLNLEQHLRQLAEYDALTGLPNRLLLRERLQQALHRSARTGRAIGLLFIDLDGFKQVNDSLGHAAGDELLCQFAARLTDNLRTSDTAARLSGDEFVMLLEDFENSAANPVAVAARLLDSFRLPYVLSGGEGHVSASIGIVFGHGERDAAEQLLQAADTAMYQAKQCGKNRYAVMPSISGDPA